MEISRNAEDISVNNFTRNDRAYIDNEIIELKDSFVEQLSPVSVYLFGSYAENKQNEDSDYDFYIIVNDSENDMIALTAKAYKSIRYKQTRDVDIIVNTRSKFESRKGMHSVENEVARKGVLLYGS